MQETVRETKLASDLEPGDWIAAGPYNGRIDGTDDAEVLFVYRRYASGGPHAISVTIQEVTIPQPELIDLHADAEITLLTAEEVACHKADLERAQKIADIRALADWLEANPDVPMAYGIGGQADLSDSQSYSATEVDAVRAFAGKHGGEFHEGKDHTSARVRFGGVTYSLISWHKDGRPAEPAPECVASLHRPKSGAVCGVCGAVGFVHDYGTPSVYSGETKHFEAGGWKGDGPGTCGIECGCGVTYDGFDSLAEAKQQLGWHIADPTGQDFGRADSAQQDDPTPVGHRVPPHFESGVDEGLVDETPDESAGIVDANLRAMGSEGLVDETPELPIHLELAGVKTMCGLALLDLDTGVGWTNYHGAVTCKACIDEMPF